MLDTQTQLKLTAMTEGGKYLGEIRQKLVDMVKPGLTLAQIDQQAEKLLLATGGEPAFKRVPDYSWSTCINLNQGIVHGIPDDTIIQDGDLVSIDVGLYYQGYYTDTSTSTIAGTAQPKLQKFLEIGRQALADGIAAATLGNRAGHISLAIEKSLAKHDLYAIPSLTGHGVGNELHEAPHIPGLLIGKLKKTPTLYPGQTLAIEVIYTPGSTDIITEPDGWTISTKDGTISGLFEETVAVLEEGPKILTAYHHS